MRLEMMMADGLELSDTPLWWLATPARTSLPHVPLRSITDMPIPHSPLIGPSTSHRSYYGSIIPVPPSQLHHVLRSHPSPSTLAFCYLVHPNRLVTDFLFPLSRLFTCFYSFRSSSPTFFSLLLAGRSKLCSFGSVSSDTG